MMDYRNDLRIRVMLEWGMTADLNDVQKMVELDKAILKVASSALKGVELQAFFFAYSGTLSWVEVTEKFSKHLDKDLELETVVRYARNASNKIVERVRRMK